LLVLVGTARAADADHADDLVIDLDEHGSGAGEVVGVRRDLIGERLVRLICSASAPEASLKAKAACALKLLFWTARGPTPSETSTAFNTPAESITLTATF